MLFTIIVVLIIGLVVLAIVINAIQQHKEEQEAQHRKELNKVKLIIDETENILAASGQLPMPVHMIGVLNNRILQALKVTEKLNPKSYDIQQRIEDAESKATIPETEVPQLPHSFALPDNDKMIIQYIQAIKKIRITLGSEHAKGRVPPQIFASLEKYFEKLQLRVNIETIYKRGCNAIASKTLGSARQYFEKAIKALEGQMNEDDYAMTRQQDCKDKLLEIQALLSAEQNIVVPPKLDAIDEQFETKTKW